MQTVKEFSKYAAEQFLRTAVIIDDNIYGSKSGRMNVPETLKVPTRKKALKTSTKDNPESVEKELEQDNNEKILWQESVASFAKKHIVCSLYEPDKKDKYTVRSDVYKLCLASDIVIVDWSLHGDDGQKALELITNLVHNSLEDIPEQLRLILVYTSEPNLGSTANNVFEELKGKLGDGIEPQTEDHCLSMHTSNSKIVILGKPTHLPRLEHYQSHEEAEKRLAERSIEEFSKLASGLLQGAVLLGLTKIRENSRKVLSKFDSSLDPAFLTHRALSLPHAEASDQVIPILMSELQSVLEDKLQPPILSNELITDWCAQWKPTDNAKKFLGNDQDIQKFAVDFILKGIGIKSDYNSISALQTFIDNDAWKVDDIDLFKQFSNFLYSDDYRNKNHEFAALMSLRTHYGNIDLTLQLGSIICSKEGDSLKYFLCLQPLCDSVRLSGKKSFIFCKLQSGDTKSKSFVVEENGKFTELLFRPSVANCAVIEFKADKSKKLVVAKDSDAGAGKCFVDTSNVIYFWVAQLKPDHAQRAAEQFASNLSRVGLTESEWLRLMSK